MPDVSRLCERTLTAPIAALGLIAGFAVAVGTGSRPLGGVVLAICGIACIVIWSRRDGRRTAGWLTLAGLLAFALSHVLGLVIGAWPAVVLVALATAGLCWRVSDSRLRRRPASGRPTAAGSGSTTARPESRGSLTETVAPSGAASTTRRNDGAS